MRILEICLFSAGIDGVFARVKQESELLATKHEVMIFSSNLTKGSEEIAKREDKIGNVRIRRFPAKKLGGESFMRWDFEPAALKFKPDVIIAHSYRHLHTTKALKVAKRVGCKLFLVTHAPFVSGNATRTSFSAFAVRFYDFFIGPRIINKFDKVIAITKWEMPYLLNLGLNKNKIEYIPNGIAEEFFKIKIEKKKSGKEGNKILFFGRISPIKDIETLIMAMKILEKEKIELEIVGPAEEEYLNMLKIMIDKLGLNDRILFHKPIFDLKEKIKKIDSARIFVLPSKREAMPQALIEAMAREKIVISSDSPGAKDLIENGKNGFLFKVGNAKELAEKIKKAIGIKYGGMGKEARKSVEKFEWNKVIKKINSLIK